MKSKVTSPTQGVYHLGALSYNRNYVEALGLIPPTPLSTYVRKPRGTRPSRLIFMFDIYIYTTVCTQQHDDNTDNLLGVEKFLRGRHAHDEGEAAHLTVSWLN